MLCVSIVCVCVVFVSGVAGSARYKNCLVLLTLYTFPTVQGALARGRIRGVCVAGKKFGAMPGPRLHPRHPRRHTVGLGAHVTSAH